MSAEIIQFPTNRALARSSVDLLGSGSRTAQILPFPRYKLWLEGPWEHLPPPKYLGMDIWGRQRVIYLSVTF